jgi:putative FmdB family regulatory protein
MPTYDYECPKCGLFEYFQSMKDEPLKKCPECGAKVRRLIGTGGGLIFKGSGFYITDYRSDDYKRKSREESSTTTTAKSSSSSKQESKPDKPAAKQASS